MMNDKVYDVLKWIAMILLPALGTLYFLVLFCLHFFVCFGCVVFVVWYDVIVGR